MALIKKDAWNKIISEHFDIFDRDTRKHLLSLNEAEKTEVLASLSAKLYNIIVDKSTEIDYGEIPKSKGDITKIPNFLQITECLDTIRGLLIEFKENTDPVDEILKAIDNLKDSKRIWEKAYTFESSVPVVFYETMALAVVSSTSLLISTSIDYIKEPSEKAYHLTLDKVSLHKNKDALLFRNIRKFNKAYKNGDIKKVMEPMIKIKDTLDESVDIVNEFSATAVISAVITAGVVLSLIGLVIPILQDLITTFFCIRQSVSEWFDIQANLLAYNAETVKLDYTKTESQREDIYKRQMNLVMKLKKISNALAVKIKSAENKATQIIKKEENNKYTIDPNTNRIHSSMF